MAFRVRSDRWILSFAFGLLLLTLPGQVRADPLPGEDHLKFQQLPLAGVSAAFPYPGHDESSTAYATQDPFTNEVTGWQGTFMADDFADTSSSPVLHVSWWGSYLAGSPNTGGVQRFLISFESDAPGAAGAPSHPGAPLLSDMVTHGPLAPGSGTFTENLVPTSSTAGGEALYKYNAELHLGKSFAEQPNTVYWLKIVALVDANSGINWGWHDRDWSTPDPLASGPPSVTPGEGVVGKLASGDDVHHFQDDAVSGSISITPLLDLVQSDFVAQRYSDGIDGPQGIEQFSKDLAFELYSKPVPEPGTASLVALGAAALAARSSRRRYARPQSPSNSSPWGPSDRK